MAVFRSIHQLCSDFDSHLHSISTYRIFIDEIVTKSNVRNAKRLREERPYLQPLPIPKVADYTEIPAVRVTTHSTINVRLVIYSVPSRLIGERFNVHLYDDRLTLYHGITEVLTLPRLYPSKGKRRGRSIKYQHLIGWLVKKPMALKGLRYRDDLLPGEIYRQIWCHIEQHLEPRKACKLMVGALKLAADHDCEQSLGIFWLDAIGQGKSPTLTQLQECFGTRPSPPPEQQFSQHELASYDALLPSMDALPSRQEVTHA